MKTNHKFSIGQTVTDKFNRTLRVWGYSKEGKVLLQTQHDSNTWQMMAPESHLTAAYSFGKSHPSFRGNKA